MSSADFHLDFQLVTEMQQEFLRAANQLDDTLRELQNVVSVANDGALLGRGGDAFSSAIHDNLSVKMSRLRDKLNELAGDLQAAMDFASGADTTSAGRFNS